MPGALIERPQMTRTMYSALKRHIMSERQKKKQEQEQDEAMERLRKEREQRKKKEAEDNMNLEQTKEQIQQLTRKMETLKHEKHELFSQLKKVLHQEDETKKKAQLKEQSEMLSLAQQYNQGLVPGHTMFMQGHLPSRTKYLSIHQPTMPPQGIKRQRTPSPPPTTIYQTYSSGPPAKYPAVSYHTAVKQEPYPTPPKQTTYPPQSTQGTYVTQAGHTYQQAPPPPSASSYAGGQAAVAAAAAAASSTGKYQPAPPPPPAGAGQSAFTSYPGPYAQHQDAITDHPGYGNYPVRRVPQSAAKVQIRHASMLSEGFIPTIHSASSLPLQQQLEQANQKSGFSEEKYKLQQQQLAAGLTPGQQAPVMTSQIAMSQHQPPPSVGAPPPKGSIMTGYPVRSQPSVTSYQQTTAGNQVRPMSTYSMSQAPRHPYQQSRGFY